MITWNNKNAIIFGLRGTLVNKDYSNEYRQVRLCSNVEKVLFYLLGEKQNIKKLLVSDFQFDQLNYIVGLTGLNIFFDELTSSADYGGSKQSVEFWSNYLSKIKQRAGDVILIDNDKSVVAAALAAGIESYLIFDPNYEPDLVGSLLLDDDELVKYKHKLSVIKSLAELLPAEISSLEPTDA